MPLLALKIIGGLLLFLFLLTLAPVRVWFSAAGGDVSLCVRYLFLRFPLLPLPEGKPARRKKPPPPEEEEEEAPAKKKKSGDRLGQIKALVASSRKALSILCRHLVIYRVRGTVRVAQPDAHRTALAYAKTAAFLRALLDVLGQLFILKTPHLNVIPDFSGEKSRYEVTFRVKIRPVFVLAAGLSLLFSWLGASRRGKSNKSKSKGGQYEHAASHR